MPCNLAALVRVHWARRQHGHVCAVSGAPIKELTELLEIECKAPSVHPDHPDRTMRRTRVVGFVFFLRFLAKLAHGMELALFNWSLATSFRIQLHCEMLTKWSFKSL